MRPVPRTGVFLFALALAGGTPAIAQEFSSSGKLNVGGPRDLSDESLCSGKREQLCTEQSRLRAHQPNTAAWEYAADDSDALEVNYSFRYLLSRPDCSVERDDKKRECVLGWDTRQELYFSYTGKFDFYISSRDSAPVINRTSNPALHWRFNKPALIGWVDWMDVALEHRSNGQTTDFDQQDADGNYVAQQRWLDGDRPYIDGISRSANYVSVELRKTYKQSGLTWWLKGKAYLDDDSMVTWGDHQGSRIWDYDVARVILQWNVPLSRKAGFGELEMDLEYTVGMKGLATDSLKASVYLSSFLWKRFLIPFNYVAMHVGPMNELSNYTEPQTSIFVGVKLNPFPGK